MRTPNKEVWNGDYKCINIECERDIPANIVEKQFTHPKNRVCTKCRNNSSINWKCIGCDKLISNNIKRIGTFYCSVECRLSSNYNRTYAKKVMPVVKKNIVGCNYCTKPLEHNRKLKFCDSKCLAKQRKLEQHYKVYKADVVKRANARNLVKHPNYDKEKREKHKKKQQAYMRRRYRIMKVVNSIKNRETYI